MKKLDMRKLINLVEAMPERKRRISDADFIKLAQQKLGAAAGRITLPDMAKFADDQGVQIPTTIRHNKSLKIDAHHWNLSGHAPDEADVDKKVSTDLGIEVAQPAQNEIDADSEYANLNRLATVSTVRRLAGAGKLYLFGRTPGRGAFFRVKGEHVDELLAQLERSFARELAAQGDSSMEEQYELLQEKIRLVASGRSTFLKSLLITGAPSSGKTFTVMQTIKALGLIEGKDYIVKKGRTTALSMYRVLIEQLNGLTIFDDCDSVKDDKNGINMLKGALDTDPIREVSYDVRGTINVASLPEAERNQYVQVLSRAMRYDTSNEYEDFEYFKEFLDKVGLLRKATKGLKRSGSSQSESEDEENTEDQFYDEEDQTEKELILHYVRTHLPNKIDFQGRIIFVSNDPEDEWDSAILTRAFHQNMSFTDEEMYHFISKIKDKMVTPGLNEEQKTEVWDFIGDLWRTGKLKRPINFRLAQQAFDLRLTSQWQKMLNQL